MENELYASKLAIHQANAAGLNLSLGSWREIFLAITDSVSGETKSMVTAAFVGDVRDGGERWRVKMPAREFDVIYDPHSARVVLVIRPRDPDRQPAAVPKSNPPLKGQVAERILADAG